MIINELLTEGSVITDGTSIANHLNNYFVNIGPSLAAEERNSNFAYETKIKESTCSTTFCFSYLNIDQVLNNLKSLKASIKPRELIKFQQKYLRYLRIYIIAPLLTAIFNLSLHTGKFVNDWKLARVQPIYKSEDRRKCENYRPISILPIVSEIFEKEIFQQLYNYLSENSLISKFLSGFRPKHSTLTLLIQMCDKWLENMDESKITGLVSLDVRKAFDSINPQILLL